MTISGLIGLLFVLIFFGLMVVFAAAGRSHPEGDLRPIPAFQKLRRAIGLAVEAGSRLHITLGRGAVTGAESAVGLVGLSVLGRLARFASLGDNPPVATSGDPSLAILAQDTLRSAYTQISAAEQYEPTSGQMVGVTPFSYAAGALPLASDEKTGANLLIGHFGAEVALLTDASERNAIPALAGTDSIPAQAILYATAQEPLIGEEVFAGGAYVQAGTMHVASLHAQDVIRWLLVAIILGGILLKFLGLDETLTNLIEGLL